MENSCYFHIHTLISWIHFRISNANLNLYLYRHQHLNCNPILSFSFVWWLNFNMIFVLDYVGMNIYRFLFLSRRKTEWTVMRTYPKCVDDTIGNEALGWINLGGVDLKSFSIKSRSDASEFSNCKIKQEFLCKNIFACLIKYDF